MRLLRVLTAVSLVLGYTNAAPAQSGSAPSASIPVAIQSVPRTNEGLAELLWKNLESEISRKSYVASRGKGPVTPYAVGDYRVVDLDNDGVPEIVLTLSTTPRLVFNELVVLSGVRDGTTQVFRYTTESLEKLRDVIVDLDKDGDQELIVPTEYAFGSGPHRIVWKVILDWSADRGFVDESSDHLAYYESLLDSATSDVLNAERDLSANSDPVSKELLAGKQMILDRLLNVTRRDADAPVRRALIWSDDTDATVRRLAVRVLATFPSDAAVARLRRLSDDPDGLVRERARAAVRDSSK